MTLHFVRAVTLLLILCKYAYAYAPAKATCVPGVNVATLETCVNNFLAQKYAAKTNKDYLYKNIPDGTTLDRQKALFDYILYTPYK